MRMFKLRTLITRGGSKVGLGRKNAGNKLVEYQVRHSTAPFPHRPGYGIGSMLPKGLIEGMQKEAAFRSKIVVYDDLIDDLEATQRELLMQRNQLKNNLNFAQTLHVNKKILKQSIKELEKQRNKAMEDKVQTMMDLASYQAEVVENNWEEEDNDQDSELGFSTFSSNVESPVDWTTSEIKSLARGHESVNVSSQFFDVNAQRQKGESHVDNIASSVSETTSSSASWGVKTQKNIANTVHDSATSTMQQHTVESTLVLTAMATHRWVKQLAPVKIDANKLVAAWNYYHADDMIEVAKLMNPMLFMAELSKAQRESSSAVASGESSELKTISMVSEEFLGSAMIGMVHFIKKEETTSDQSSSASKTEEAGDNKPTWDLAHWIAGTTGTYAHIEQTAKKIMNSFSETGIDVVFNIVVQGYMPTMKQSIVKDSIKKLAAFSPQTVDAASDAQMLAGLDSSLWRAEQMRYAQLVGQAQTGSGAMVKATIEGLTDAYENSYRVLDYNTFMTTFDDYIKKAPRDENAGIPIGMNVKQWTKAGVLMVYREYYRERMEQQLKKMRDDQRKREDDARRRSKQIRAQVQAQNQSSTASSSVPAGGTTPAA